MRVRILLVTCCAALASLALAAGGCGEGEVEGLAGQTPPRAGLKVAQANLVTVTPTVELTGLGEDGELGSVYVDDLLLHVSEIRLTPLDLPPVDLPPVGRPAGAEAPEYVAEPIWIEFNHASGAVARGLAPLQVPAGRYHVSLNLAPSRFQKRTAGELNEASVVVRGSCIVIEQVEDTTSPQGPAIPGGRSPGFQSNNPVPMPARPNDRDGAYATSAQVRTRMLQVPFSVKTAASLSIHVAEPLELGPGNDGTLTVRMDVPAWVEAAIHPMIAEVVRAHASVPAGVVELDFAGDGQDDPMAAILAEIIGRSMTDSLSAQAQE